MKKILTLAVVAFSLATVGCGSSSTTTGANKGSATTEKSTTVTTDKATKAQ